MRLSISKHIYSALSQSADVNKAVGKKIFPIATKNEVEFPFIVYERDLVTPRYDKAGASTSYPSLTEAQPSVLISTI